jgi:DNA-binding NtrC family response regulator
MKQKRQLLIIYREPAVISLFTECLSNQGFQIISANNCEDVFNSPDNNNFPLILLDNEILSNHIDLANKFLRINPDVQIILITTKHRALINEHDEKFFDVIYMPFGCEELKRVVNNAFKKIKLIEERNLLVRRIKEKNTDFEFTNPIIFNSCFISYSSKDETIAQ